MAQNEPNPLHHARTTMASWWERMWLAPYWVNYHCEHHMFTLMRGLKDVVKINDEDENLYHQNEK